MQWAEGMVAVQWTRVLYESDVLGRVCPCCMHEDKMTGINCVVWKKEVPGEGNLCRGTER